MWAWRLEAPGKGLDYKQVPEPVVRAGTVRVRVDAAPLLSYLRAYTAGEAVRAGTVAVAAVIAGAVTSEHAGTIALFAVRLAVVSWLAGFAVGTCSPNRRAMSRKQAPCLTAASELDRAIHNWMIGACEQILELTRPPRAKSAGICSERTGPVPRITCVVMTCTADCGAIRTGLSLGSVVVQ